MTALRRFLVFQTFMLWQGGFLFYTAFVVPVGTKVLGSGAAQGAITSRVTEALNAIGAAGVSLLAWELAVTRDPDRRRTAARWWCWAVALVCQYLMLVFHELLVSFMDPDRRHVVIRPPFYPVHRMYLWASTVQWLALLPLAWWTLRAWAAESASAGLQPAFTPGGATRPEFKPDATAV
ncbi:hypothetical protein J0H58_26655 [bacterium]|nr:hypothetical protein [bacterium]